MATKKNPETTPVAAPPNEDSAPKAAPKKRVPPGTLKLQFAGGLVLVKKPGPELLGLFRRYEEAFEAFANMDPTERLINYRFINALMLTSHAKKCSEIQQKKQLFDLKNQLFLTLANDRETRKKLAFMYLVSKNFRVTEFCQPCTERNTAEGLSRHHWKFCDNCKIDRNFFNVLSMHHKFEHGSATLFLSHELIPQVKGLQIKKKGKLDDISEEAIYKKYHYNVRNLDAFDLQSVLDWHKKLVAKA